MRKITLYVSDEQYSVVQSLAEHQTKGNWSAMLRWVIDKFVMPDDYEFYRGKNFEMQMRKQEVEDDI